MQLEHRAAQNGKQPRWVTSALTDTISKLMLSLKAYDAAHAVNALRMTCQAFLLLAMIPDCPHAYGLVHPQPTTLVCTTCQDDARYVLAKLAW
jgi:hypothetical protein